MKFIFTLSLSSLFLIQSCGPAAKTSDSNAQGSDAITGNMQLLDANSVVNFDSLPLQAKVDNSQKFWSGDHWPINRGAISRRWYSPLQEVATVSPTRDEALIMGQDQLYLLAPSEKLDLALGRYEYPFRNEVNAMVRHTALNWEGLGNGQALASLNFNDPAPKSIVNPDGVSVPFGSSDIKALLSYYFAIKNSPLSKQLGLRCEQREGWHESSPECKDDINPGALHIALANRIGLQNQGLIADIDRYQEVWNHPIYGYKSEIVSEIPSENAPADTVRTLYVKTSIYYADRGPRNSWYPVKGTADQLEGSRIYSYHLYLNAQNDIIGGQWKSSDRPDFIWMVDSLPEFSGDMAILSQLVSP